MLSKTILEELLNVYSRFNIEQICHDEEDALHKFEIIKMDRHWINLMRVQVVAHRSAGVEQNVVEDFHKDSWMSIHSTGFVITRRELKTDQRKHKFV